MKKTRFQESAEKFKKETFRQYAKSAYEWPDAETEQAFDQAVAQVEKKRGEKYAADVMARYPQKFLEKVFSWATDNLSELKMNQLGNFQNLATEYILENQDKVTGKEIGLFFDAKGNPKALPKSPSETELIGIELDPDNNPVEVVRPKKKEVSRPPVPSIERVKKMSLQEMEKMFSDQGIDVTSLEGVEEANRR
jgi:hypothetical protein